jgi:stage V sporulation protein G
MVTDGTVTVEINVLGIEQLRGTGKLVAMAVVQVAIAEVELVLQGVQLRVNQDGRILCQAPMFKHPQRGYLPCIIMPGELTNAIAREVLDASGMEQPLLAGGVDSP